MAEDNLFGSEAESFTAPPSSFPEAEVNPNQRLCSVLLNEFNYLPWSRAVTLALGGRSKLGFVNGTIEAPEDSSPEYEAWLCKDQLVMSWLLNSMDPKLSEIFSFSESSLSLWKAVKDMYGNQNNAARVFQLKRNLASLQQGDKSFVHHLGCMKNMWNELDMYRPHTIDAAILLKRSEEDKIFHLLASLGSEYEDLRSHILMNPELPSFASVCTTIQREEVRRKVMNVDIKSSVSEARAFVTNHKSSGDRVYKGKRPDLKCLHCNNIGHLIDRCWILHPELKPKFENKPSRDYKGSQTRSHTTKNHAAAATSIDGLMNFTANPANLINEFSAYLHTKKGSTSEVLTGENQTALLGQFAGFLAESNRVPQGDVPGIMCALSTALNVSHSHDFWIIDSGATDHMTNQYSKLYNFESYTTPSLVSIANGRGVPVLGRGKVKLISDSVESTALYVPSFPFQLLSVGRITNSLNCRAIFSPHNVVFQDLATKKLIGEGHYLNGLYYFSKNLNVPKGFQVSSNLEHQLWHQRLAHPSEFVLSTLFPSLCKSSLVCEICHLSKFTRLPFNSSISRASKLFEMVHSDVWGPAPLESFDGYRYYVTFVDDFSRVTWLYLLKFKSEVMDAFKNFHNLVMNHFSSQIHILRSDNGTEYTSKNMTNYLSTHGIIHQTSCVGTPQQNGIAERKNRDLLEKTRALMLQMNVPKRFWSQGVLTATYLINRLPSRVLDSKSPYEVMQNKKINLSHLRIFGCTCYAHIQSHHRDKLDPKAIKCVFMGYSSTQKGYKCYNPCSRKLFVSRDVRFDELKPYFNKPSDQNRQGEHLLDFFPLPNPVETSDCVHSVPHNSDSHATNIDNVIIGDETEASEAQVVPHDNDTSSIEESGAEPTVIPSQPRRNPTRDRHPPSRLQDYVTFNVRYPIHKFVNYSKVSHSHAAFLSKLSNESEPRNFQEANLQDVWRLAMEEELKALDENKTWSVVQLPKGKKVVGSRWIYKTKFNSDGSIERHKARLVARGFTQTFGVDYKETFAPVAKMSTVRVLLSVAINHEWPLYQMDVKNAFLHGDLEEEVYMQLPPGHPQAQNSSMVCKLHKSIYGLKQSPRAWYAKLSSVLEKFGFKRSHADSSLFVRTGSVGKLVVLIYVDDIIITGDNIDEINTLKHSLHQKFAIKDLGVLKYFLGIEMATSPKGLFLSQRKYVIDLLQEVKMIDCKPARTPLDSKLKLDLEGEPLSNISHYQRLVGKLIYLTITRPDITYAVSLVSQFMHAPTEAHLNVVKRILRYLKGSIGRGIIMKNNGHTQIMAYTDADWAGNAIDRKSTTGYCTFVGGNIVTWKSKKQNVIARSSAEAEYRAMASTACELIWLKSLISDLGFLSNKPMSLFCDNQAAMHIASNPVFHERTKHIEVDCHYVREQVQSKVIQTTFTRSHDQLADVFTKSLASTQFQRLLSKLGSINPFDPA